MSFQESCFHRVGNRYIIFIWALGGKHYAHQPHRYSTKNIKTELIWGLDEQHVPNLEFSTYLCNTDFAAACYSIETWPGGYRVWVCALIRQTIQTQLSQDLEATRKLPNSKHFGAGQIDLHVCHKAQSLPAIPILTQTEDTNCKVMSLFVTFIWLKKLLKNWNTSAPHSPFTPHLSWLCFEGSFSTVYQFGR